MIAMLVYTLSDLMDFVLAAVVVLTLLVMAIGEGCRKLWRKWRGRR